MAALTVELKEARKINKYELERVLNKYLYMDANEIKKAVADPNTLMLDLIVCRIILNAVKYGDHKGFEFLCERVLGVIPKAKIDDNNDATTVVFIDPKDHPKKLDVVAPDVS